MTPLVSLVSLALSAHAADAAPAPTSASPAETAPRVSIGAEVGWQAVGDSRWAVFSRGDTLVTTGFRASWTLRPWLRAEASWGVGDSGLAYGATQTTLDGGMVPSDTSTDAFRSRFRAHVSSLGLRVAKPVVGPVELSATLEGTAMSADAQFDDDPGKDDNAGQAVAEATATGARVLFGVTAPFQLSRGRWIAPYLEVGAGSFAELAFGEIGSLGVAGSCGRFGVSARF